VIQTAKDPEIVGPVGRLGAAGAEHVMSVSAWAAACPSRLVADGLVDGFRWQGVERLGVYRTDAGCDP